MKATKLILVLLLLDVAGASSRAQQPGPQQAGRMPVMCKWLNNNEVAFTYNGSYTDAFKVANGLDKLPFASVALFPKTFLFRIQAPGLEQGDRVALIGDQPALGNWDVERALPMIPSSNGE